MKDTFDVYAWNKSRYLNENKGREEADKIIRELRSSVIKKLNDEELTLLMANNQLSLVCSSQSFFYPFADCSGSAGSDYTRKAGGRLPHSVGFF
jgi:hypothetical protein